MHGQNVRLPACYIGTRGDYALFYPPPPSHCALVAAIGCAKLKRGTSGKRRHRRRRYA